MGHTVLGCFELALIWVSTHFNPADFPSRNIPLPPPGLIPEAYRQYFAHGPWEDVCCSELFSGVGMLTKAFRDAGHRMAQPWDIKLSSHFDILNKETYAKFIDILESGDIKWVWMAPPCWSHSAAQNGRVGGPLRSKEAHRPEIPSRHARKRLVGSCY